ncbi:MAG: SBBP repeat-containing protein [Acidobacteria bacterium]|nr:SBBP repeat-containing protein [Acidobacteriota bacterium]
MSGHNAKHPIVMRFLGAHSTASGAGEAPLPGIVNYLIGSDPAKWRTNVPTYAAVRYRDIYQGIDLRHYSAATGELEHDLIVAPGADPRQIAMAIDGADDLRLDDAGAIVLTQGGAALRLRRPVTYQDTPAGRRVIPSAYQVAGGRIGITLGEYDASLTLVIDPILVYSTYLGGSSTDDGYALAVDASGSAYVAGLVMSSNFPTVSGSYDTAIFGPWDAFVSKFNASGALVYSTFLGGSGSDYAVGIAVDSSGNAYVTGSTASFDFPIASAYQSTLQGGRSAFVTKLNASGTGLTYSTYLGGSGYDDGLAIAVDASGNAYIGGQTTSSNFPTSSAVQATYGGANDGFITKMIFSSNTLALAYSSYFGGSGADRVTSVKIYVASGFPNAVFGGATSSPNIPLAGAFDSVLNGVGDGFVARLAYLGSLIGSTYLGGTGDDAVEAIAVDSSGSVYATGSTASTNFPTAGAAQAANAGGIDAFVTKLNSSQSAVLYSTYLGGSLEDTGLSVAVDSAGAAHVVGLTKSANFPTSGAILSLVSGQQEAFLTRMSVSGSSRTYSTYLGGSGTDTAHGVAVTSAGDVWVTGRTGSSDFPELLAAQPSFGGGSVDAFLVRLKAPVPTLSSISPASRAAGTSVTVTLTGTNFEPYYTNISVSGSGVTVSDANFVTATQMTASLVIDAMASLGGRTLTATTPDGAVSGGQTFTVTAPVPVLVSLSPSQGSIGSAVEVTLTGTNMSGVTSVNIGGATGIVVSNVIPSSTSVSCFFIIASNATWGTRSVTVSSSGGTSSPLTFVTSPFSDDPLVAGVTTIKAAHIAELRTAINEARVANNLAAYTFSTAVPTAGASAISAAVITELRSALQATRTSLGYIHVAYTDPVLSETVPIKAIHIQELRDRIVGLRVAPRPVAIR